MPLPVTSQKLIVKKVNRSSRPVCQGRDGLVTLFAAMSF